MCFFFKKYVLVTTHRRRKKRTKSNRTIFFLPVSSVNAGRSGSYDLNYGEVLRVGHNYAHNDISTQRRSTSEYHARIVRVSPTNEVVRIIPIEGRFYMHITFRQSGESRLHLRGDIEVTVGDRIQFSDDDVYEIERIGGNAASAANTSGQPQPQPQPQQQRSQSPAPTPSLQAARVNERRATMHISRQHQQHKQQVCYQMLITQSTYSDPLEQIICKCTQ